ncbi:MAG: acetyl-CoA carboxylase biotin carboxylase subunit, partial [Nitrospinae bacterium]|nr:acetyl-CoA carboxylase biotin carboxylase subunit [Nitrospinota bacterium]
MHKILIVNRGEIAIRIIRACRELGIQSVAVFSEPDREALFVKMADESVCIGPALATKSYLNIPAIITVAEHMEVTAVHPGYGFLAENARFAEICEKCNITFIGPESDTIDLLGSKEKSRNRAKELGIPLPPGSKDILKNSDEAKKVAKEIGYPIMLKAAAGGGGRGIRVVR